MALEHFKTQVLLLHSEQSTLDNLSTGFGDRYTVHCATSGSAALTTLGEVSIHVIVSAQDLPGMSGLEALREARKRSPETIGILLAGDSGEDVEALVGDKDMFQVVHGSVTADSLRTLIEGATQQARLIALAKSANDTSANMDQPTGEHIVMETSENGSAIISDGTGRMPVLNPEKIGAQASTGAHTVDVLVLTQDEEFLQTVKESSRGMHNVYNATTISQADDIVREHTVGVAVIDAAMVGANVEKMTLHLRGTTARLVAIVAGRRDDGEMLMDLINRGKVYRFLLKPVSPGRARLAIEASVKHHLEAPDSAFRLKTDPSRPAAAPAPKPPRTEKTSEQPASTATQKAPAGAPRKAPESVEATKRARKESSGPDPVRATRTEEPRSVLPEIKVEPRISPTKADQPDESLPDDGLSDAFGDESSLKETVSGLFKGAGKKSTQDSESAALDAATSDSGGSLFSDPKVLGVAAVAVVAAVLGGWWLMSGSDSVSVEPPPVASNPSPAAGEPAAATVTEPEPAVPAEPQVDIDELLAEAREAVADNRFVEPAGGNAIELYLTAAAALPGNPTVASELDSAIDRALGVAESALLERRTDEAATALDRVALADPNHPRLPFLTSQMQEIQLRDYLADARAAIRESRFDEASDALISARSLDPADTSEIELVAQELGKAQNDEAVAGVLQQAGERLDDGMLVGPAEDNARYYYRQALETAPNNAAARQGLVVVANKLVLNARTEIDARNFSEAEALLAEARNTDPESAELANADAALAAERARVEQERIEAERLAAEKAAAEKAAAERAEQERLAREREAADRAERERLARELEAAKRAEQERLALEREAAERAEQERLALEQERLTREREAAERAAAEQRAAEQRAAARAAAAAKLAAGAQPQSTRQATPPAQQQTQATSAPPQPVAAAATRTEPAAPVPAPASTTPARQAPQAAPPAAPIPVSSLVRTKYVAPRYPRSAQRRSLTGWVDMIFTVDIDGSVKDIDVAGSNPGDTFVESATKAVEDWKFEPVIQNGVAVEKRAAVRMMFAIE